MLTSSTNGEPAPISLMSLNCELTDQFVISLITVCACDDLLFYALVLFLFFNLKHFLSLFTDFSCLFFLCV